MLYKNLCKLNISNAMKVRNIVWGTHVLKLIFNGQQEKSRHWTLEKVMEIQIDFERK